MVAKYNKKSNNDASNFYSAVKSVIDSYNIVDAGLNNYQKITMFHKQYEDLDQLSAFIKNNENINKIFISKRIGDVIPIDKKLHKLPIHTLLDFVQGVSFNHIPKCYDSEKLVFSAVKY